MASLQSAPFGQLPQSEEQQQQLTEMRETLGRIDELERSPAFRWFMEQAVKPHLKQAEADTFDLEKTPAQVEVARHLRAALKEVADFLTERRSLAADHVKNAQS